MMSCSLWLFFANVMVRGKLCLGADIFTLRLDEQLIQ